MNIFLFIYWPFKCSTIQNTSVKSSDLCFAFIRFAFRRLQLRLKQQFAAFIEWLQLLLVCLLLILVLLFLLNGGQFKARNWRWPCQIALVIVAVRLPVWVSARLQSVNVPSSSFYRFCDCFRSSEKTRIANFKHASMISRHWNSICIVHTPRCPQAHIPRFTRAAARGQGWAGHSSDAQERRGEGCRDSHLAFVFRRVCGSASQRLVASSGNAWQICKQIYVVHTIYVNI